MMEFVTYTIIGWKRVRTPDSEYADKTGEIVSSVFPDREYRERLAQKLNADYVTIEKRYEYGELPFGE